MKRISKTQKEIKIFLVKSNHFSPISSQHIIDLIRSVCDSPNLNLLITPPVKTAHSSKFIPKFQVNYH
jgi:hypothetical protein